MADADVADDVLYATDTSRVAGPPLPDTLDPPEGTPIVYLPLDELVVSDRPMTVLERVEQAALTLPLGSKEQTAAAKLFLSKVMPDLKAVELTGKGGKPISVVIAATDEDAKL